MRITGGKWKGRRPKVIKGFKGRPTTDFGREGLFNLLNARVDLEGLHVLELFGGTGMVALEFLSRDCGSVTSVESDAKAVRGMTTLARDWDVDDWSVGSRQRLQFIERSLTQYDLIFADPPYDLPELPELRDRVWAAPCWCPALVYLGARRTNRRFGLCALRGNPEVRSRPF